MGWVGWNRFFHGRADRQSCILMGWMRIAFACLVLCDRALLTMDLDEYFLSGKMPYTATSKDYSLYHGYSVFQLAPDTPSLYHFMHWLGIAQAFLLLLGIAPRLQLLGLHVNMVSFQHHSNLIWDGEDQMFSVWNALMLLLPVHCVTVFDGFGKRVGKDQTWPMFGPRLWQINICLIYAGAGFGKLSSERWQNGTAMYHIVHTTDFFGGAFTPDILFNRLGPLMFVTWSSLILESTCPFLIWPQATRLPTIISMLLMHLGIELAMNMHCFEWSSALGWLIFWVKEHNDRRKEPVKERTATSTSKSLETAATSAPEETTIELETVGNATEPKKDSALYRYSLNALLLLVVSEMAVDMTPLDEIHALAPASLQDPIGHIAESRSRFREEYIARFLLPVGLYQGVWNMFCNASNESFQYEVVMDLHDGTSLSWLSPDWSTMAWYEKKRWQRPMSFYDHLDIAPRSVWDAFVRYQVAQHGPGVVSASLLVHTATPPNPPADLGYWEPAKQETFRETRELYVLNLCADFDDQCGVWADAGLCEDYGQLWLAAERCRWSCNFCTDVTDIALEDHVAVYWSEDHSFYDATIREIRTNPLRFLLEFDQYDEESERFEWNDYVEMRMRRFVVWPRQDDIIQAPSGDKDHRTVRSDEL